MDLNLVVVSGRLAAPPELRQFESGARLARYLVTVRSEEPTRRVDVLPVTLWDPCEELLDEDPAPGRRLWAVGSIQRRFWSATEGRRSHLELVADQVCLRPPDEEEDSR
ncbi:MAG TPA: single-stranded DNA-binding protein [Acidimicrobiia bacterium]|nr:single-stranded DNA-binding protein [Acidimicrobiia bacterium]